MKDNQILPAGDPAVRDDTPLQSQPGSPHRILVVEDDCEIRRINTEVLTRSGYEVDAAEDGAVAWDNLQLNSYDLLVTDNNMPKVSGVELLKKLHAAHMALPVVMVTGTVPKEEFARHPWLQPAATLLKPYTAEEMLRTVKKVLRETDCTTDSSKQFKHRDIQDDKIPQTGEPAGAPLQRPTHSPHRILVVDGDRDLRLLYTDVLAAPAYYVDGAEDGAAGWEALQANSYNILITEHDLPGLTGVELVRKLRAARMALPVVMAASRLPVAELTRDPSLQLAATLEKPFAIDALLDTVRNVLRVADSAREQITPLSNGRSQPLNGGLRF